jgi:hypothetical protein
MGNLEPMGAHEIPSITVQSILGSARRFGLSEAATWAAMDDALLASGTDATVAEYFDELAGKLARRILLSERPPSRSAGKGKARRTD